MFQSREVCRVVAENENHRTKKIFMDTPKLFKQPLGAFSLLIMISLVTGFAACDDINMDGTKGKGQINFYLTNSADASKTAATESVVYSTELENSQDGELNQSVESLEEVNLDVQVLRVRFTESASDTVQTDTTENDDDATKWVNIEITPVKINLLDFTSADTLLSDSELDEGFYSEIRLVLGSDNDVVVNGDTHSLKVPSGQQSGYKIKFGGERLDSGEIVDLTIEFNAEKSVLVTGNGQYILKPVLHAFKGRD